MCSGKNLLSVAPFYTYELKKSEYMTAITCYESCRSEYLIPDSHYGNIVVQRPWEKKSPWATSNYFFFACFAHDWCKPCGLGYRKS